jgi:hypothetical protein
VPPDGFKPTSGIEFDFGHFASKAELLHFFGSWKILGVIFAEFLSTIGASTELVLLIMVIRRS